MYVPPKHELGIILFGSSRTFFKAQEFVSNYNVYFVYFTYMHISYIIIPLLKKLNFSRHDARHAKI